MQALARHIAWRYFNAQRRTGAVGWLAAISVTGIGLGTAALIIVLSVFNGFQRVIDGVFAQFDPDLQVVATSGQPFTLTDSLLQALQTHPGVAAVSASLSGRAVLSYYDLRAVVTLQGIDSQFTAVSRAPETLVAGRFEVGSAERMPLPIVAGAGVANRLEAPLGNAFQPIRIATVAQGSNLLGSPERALQEKPAMLVGVFSLQKEYDDRLVLAPLAAVQALTGQPGKASALAIRLKEHVAVASTQRSLEGALGPAFQVRNRAQQHQSLYRILVAEKWVGYAVISLILLVASATVIGTLSIIVSHKAREIGTLATLGARPGFLRSVFLWMGLYVGGSAGLAGLLLGGTLAGMQQAFGWVPINGGENFLIDAFPVALQATDFLAVGTTVLVLALLAASLPAHLAARARVVENLHT